MKEFVNLNYEHLHTFQSEKIGIQYWYKGTMEIDGRIVVFCFYFDGEDLCEGLEKEEYDDEDVENYATDMAYCQAEVIASNKDYIKVADESIERYNNGTFYKIATNAQYAELADNIQDHIDYLISDFEDDNDVAMDINVAISHIKSGL